MKGIIKNIPNKLIRKSANIKQVSKQTKYADFLCFDDNIARLFFNDIIKYYTECKHSNVISFDTYTSIIKQFRVYLENHKTLLIDSSYVSSLLIDCDHIRINNYIENVFNLSCEVIDDNSKCSIVIPQELVQNISDTYNYEFFTELSKKVKASCTVGKYELERLINDDYIEIQDAILGKKMYAEGYAPAFYLDTTNTPNSEYSQIWLNQYVMNSKLKKIIWKVRVSSTDKIIALIYLGVNDENTEGLIEVLCDNDILDSELGQAIRLVKLIALKKLGLEKVIGINRNQGFAYSNINTAFHFAGFKATYNIDHSTFESSLSSVPEMDEIYSDRPLISILDNIDVQFD